MASSSPTATVADDPMDARPFTMRAATFSGSAAKGKRGAWTPITLSPASR